jgi:hypothetical protein
VKAAFAAAVALLLVVAAAATGQDRRAGREGVRTVQTRTSIWGGEELVIVEGIGADVRLRWVRVAAVNDWCPGRTIEAIERTLPRTTVQAVVDAPVCGLSEAAVEAAVRRSSSRQDTVDFFGSIEAVVADCPSGERGFLFKQQPIIDRDQLKRRDPGVARIWGIAERLRGLVTGRDDPYFQALPVEGRAERERLGTSLMPDLIASAYGELMRPLVTGYTGPPAIRAPDWVDVVGLDPASLATYVEPQMPQIAISARVFADVPVLLTVDPTSGAVVRAEAGPKAMPLLTEAALAAARQWRFAPGAGPREPVEVTLRFRPPTCGGEPAH